MPETTCEPTIEPIDMVRGHQRQSLLWMVWAMPERGVEEMAKTLTRIAEFHTPTRPAIGDERMNEAICQVCGEPMPQGEEVFNFHGYSGPCPKPPLPRRFRCTNAACRALHDNDPKGHCPTCKNADGSGWSCVLEVGQRDGGA